MIELLGGLIMLGQEHCLPHTLKNKEVHDIDNKLVRCLLSMKNFFLKVVLSLAE